MSADWGINFSDAPKNKVDVNSDEGEYPIRWHIRPTYLRRSSTWINGAKCSVCNTTGTYEDLHPVDPCPRCGSKSIREIVVRWEPKKTWWTWWTKWRQGRWVTK